MQPMAILSHTAAGGRRSRRSFKERAQHSRQIQHRLLNQAETAWVNRSLKKLKTLKDFTNNMLRQSSYVRELVAIKYSRMLSRKGLSLNGRQRNDTTIRRFKKRRSADSGRIRKGKADYHLGTASSTEPAANKGRKEYGSTQDQ